jgi:hypothetical protein
MVKLVAPASLRTDQAGLLEYVEVLRHRLAGRREPVLCCEPGAELEQRLRLALDELVEDRPTGGVGQCLENVDLGHNPMLGKYPLACPLCQLYVNPVHASGPAEVLARLGRCEDVDPSEYTLRTVNVTSPIRTY